MREGYLLLLRCMWMMLETGEEGEQEQEQEEEEGGEEEGTPEQEREGAKGRKHKVYLHFRDE